MAKKVSKKKPQSHLEPYDIEEWAHFCVDAVVGEIKKAPNLVWAEMPNGTIWPHKVVRDA